MSGPSNQQKRSRNFSQEEKESLVDEISIYQHIIENKNTNQIVLEQKEATWEKICKSHNLKFPYERTVVNLKTQWNNLKKLTRAYNGELQQKLYGTGGGACTVDMNPLYERVRGIMHEPSVKCLQNIYDSDSIPTSDGAIIEMDDESFCDMENADPNFDIYSHLKKTNMLNDWSKYSVEKLKSPISLPLLNKINASSCTVTSQTRSDNNANIFTNSDGQSNADEYVIDDELISKDLFQEENVKIHKKFKKSNDTNSQQKEEISQDELTKLIIEHAKEKHKLEIEILKKSLKKEELGVTEKELRIQILHRELRKANLEHTYGAKRNY